MGHADGDEGRRTLADRFLSTEPVCYDRERQAGFVDGLTDVAPVSLAFENYLCRDVVTNDRDSVLHCRSPVATPGGLASRV